MKPHTLSPFSLLSRSGCPHVVWPGATCRWLVGRQQNSTTTPDCNPHRCIAQGRQWSRPMTSRLVSLHPLRKLCLVSLVGGPRRLDEQPAEELPTWHGITALLFVVRLLTHTLGTCALVTIYGRIPTTASLAHNPRKPPPRWIVVCLIGLTASASSLTLGSSIKAPDQGAMSSTESCEGGGRCGYFLARTLFSSALHSPGLSRGRVGPGQ